jgi:UTP--glucose-1-phosphate uridylyltransferase
MNHTNHSLPQQGNHYSLFEKKMKDKELDTSVIEAFQYYYNLLLSGEKGKVYEKDISNVLHSDIPQLKDLDHYASFGKEVLNKTVIIKLNGGLGTTMGLGMNMAKSLLPIKHNYSFLEIYFHQIMKYKNQMPIPLILMNSFNTHDKTLEAIKTIGAENDVDCFIQNMFPKVEKDTYRPASFPNNPSLEWNPPGHGEIYVALKSSGMLKKCLDQGIQYAFISNSDNIGAVLNLSLLGYVAGKQLPFVMEVVRRGPLDTKGGHLALHKSGKLILRELSQCPKDEMHLFEDISLYQFFNTNNLWVNLPMLSEYLEQNHFVPLPMICNPKTLNPADASTPCVYQLETAMGNAISVFENSSAVIVNHRRYIPVKRNEQLLVIWSDYYLYDVDNNLYPNPKRQLGPIHIKLDETYYSAFDHFTKRFPEGAPSLVDCESLTVKGDVLFKKNVVIKGNVTIENKTSSPLIIEQDRILENDHFTR